MEMAMYMHAWILLTINHQFGIVTLEEWISNNDPGGF